MKTISWILQAQEPETNKVVLQRQWKKNQKQIKLLNCFEGQEEAETNKVKGKIRTGEWELLKRQRSPLDHEICHSSMDEKKDL